MLITYVGKIFIYLTCIMVVFIVILMVIMTPEGNQSSQHALVVSIKNAARANIPKYEYKVHASITALNSNTLALSGSQILSPERLSHSSGVDNVGMVEKHEADKNQAKLIQDNYGSEVHQLAFDSNFSLAKAKKILFYDEMTNQLWRPYGIGHSPFVTHRCPVSNCYLTTNLTLLPSLGDFDAILFNFYHKLQATRQELESYSKIKR